ncbi:MAG: hypothetical protein JWM76_3051 [Pseudonocardiales bacterium]|nr:hypothetical protein [Pseudonocardiales bacterium]
MSEQSATLADRASALLELGRAAEAEAVVRSALQIDPDDVDLLLILSQALLAQSRYDKAQATAELAVAADPSSVTGLSCLAAAASGRGKFRVALTAVDRALQIAPDFADLHRQRAQILLADGRTPLALESAYRARELSPQNADVAAVLAEALSKNGQQTLARTEVSRALSLEPDSARNHRAAGRIGLHEGGREQSLRHFREALRLDPTDPSARAGFAAALKSRNPVYRQLLLFEFWFSSLPTQARWFVRLAPLVLVRVLASLGDGPIVLAVLIPVLLVFVVSWATEPVLNLLLMASPVDRYLLTKRERTATAAFAGCAALSIGSLFGAALGSDRFVPYIFMFGLLALLVTASAHVRGALAYKMYVAIVGLALIVGLAGITFVILGLDNASIGALTVMLASLFLAAVTTRIAK